MVPAPHPSARRPALLLDLPCLKQEAGAAICDALLDYYLPNQAQRERAHRDLLVRDGVKDGSRLGLPPVTVAAAVGSASKSGGINDRGGAESSGGSDREGAGGQDGDGRDDDDDVSFSLPMLKWTFLPID